MGFVRIVPFLMLAGGVALVTAVARGAAPGTALVGLFPICVFLAASVIVLRLFGRQVGKRVAELPRVGIRRTGVVREARPYASRDGGVVPRHGGTPMVLAVELEASGEHPSERVEVLAVEPSERACARIGTEVVVLEHPEAEQVRALDGFEPSGRPRRS